MSIAVKMMAGIHYINHIADVSDEVVQVGWLETSYWQYLTRGLL